MKLITRDTDYALRAICFIAKNKKAVVSASYLYDNLGVQAFLKKDSPDIAQLWCAQVF